MTRKRKRKQVQRWDLHSLPSDMDDLQALAVQLKRQEIRLEIDLAIRERPELEESILRVLLAYSDVRVGEDMERAVLAIGGGDAESHEIAVRCCEDIKARINEISASDDPHKERRLVALNNRYLALRDVITSDWNAMELEGVRLKLHRAVAVLRKEVARALPIFESLGVELVEFFPLLAPHLVVDRVGG